MVIYYSWKGHTKVYAEILASLLNDKLFALEETVTRDSAISAVKAGYQSIAKKESAVKIMPDISQERTLYICTPIWAGNLTPAVRFFLNHADLSGKTVHFIAVCANISGTESYTKNLLYILKDKNCETGACYVFPGQATSDSDTIREHMKELIHA